MAFERDEPLGSDNRRVYLKTIGSAISTLGVAGCRSLTSSSNSGGAGGNGTGRAEDVPKDALKGQTLKIGGLFPRPNDFAPGIDGMQAAKMAVREHNQSNNGVLGADLELVVSSTDVTPGATRKNARKLVRNENVDVLQGGMLGNTYKQMLEPAANNNKMCFYTAGASNAVTRKAKENWDRYKITFRTMNTMWQVQMSIVLFLKDIADQMGWDRVGIFTENVELFDPLGKPLAKRLRGMTDLDVPVVKRTSTSVLNWKPLFDQLEQQNVDLMLANLVLTGTTAARQWGVQERPFEFGGINLYAMSDDFWNSVGGVCPGLWTFNHIGIGSQATKEVQEFQDNYEQMWGYRTNTYSAATCYDAVNVWVDAIKKTGSTEPVDLIPYLEERKWDGATIKPSHDYYKPGEDHSWLDTTTPHCLKWIDEPTIEGWNREGWLPATQFLADKKGGNDGKMRVVAPPRAAGGEYKVKRAPWNR